MELVYFYIHFYLYFLEVNFYKLNQKHGFFFTVTTPMLMLIYGLYMNVV